MLKLPPLQKAKSQVILLVFLVVVYDKLMIVNILINISLFMVMFFINKHIPVQANIHIYSMSIARQHSVLFIQSIVVYCHNYFKCSKYFSCKMYKSCLPYVQKGFIDYLQILL